MNPKQVIDFFGTQTNTAKSLGIAQSSVAGWVQAGEVPMDRQYQIELASDGQLRADLPALRMAKSAA
jgi:DNA-binding transcriptional regulator YdaS (Cro superfamily)